MPQTEAEIAEAGYIQDKIKDAAFNREAALPWRTPAEGDRNFNCFWVDGGGFWHIDLSILTAFDFAPRESFLVIEPGKD